MLRNLQISETSISTKVPLHLLLLHTFLSNKEKYAVGDITALLFACCKQKISKNGMAFTMPFFYFILSTENQMTEG